MARDSNSGISVDDLLKAYSLGYFPMAKARDEENVLWILPDERGVIETHRFRVSRSLRKRLRTNPFEIRINSAFNDVIIACGEANNRRPDTWINNQIIEAYTELHFKGRAHCVECWRNGMLVGGLYGVDLGGAFCGESMFSRERDASKVAMAHLMARVKIGGYQFIDAQFFNEHLVQFGLEAMPNNQYQRLLIRALASEGDFFAAGDQLSDDLVLQSITQTS